MGVIDFKLLRLRTQGRLADDYAPITGQQLLALLDRLDAAERALADVPRGGTPFINAVNAWRERHAAAIALACNSQL